MCFIKVSVIVIILGRVSLWAFAAPQDHYRGQELHSDCGCAVACSAAAVGFPRPFAGAGIQWLRGAVCVPETKGQLTRCSFHGVFYINPACFL